MWKLRCRNIAHSEILKIKEGVHLNWDPEIMRRPYNTAHHIFPKKYVFNQSLRNEFFPT